jgi:hypothetical protein
MTRLRNGLPGLYPRQCRCLFSSLPGPDRLWAHPASHPMCNGSSFPGGEAAGREADHSPLSSAEVKNAWRYDSTPHTSSYHGVSLRTGYILQAWYLFKHGDKSTLAFYLITWGIIGTFLPFVLLITTAPPPDMEAACYGLLHRASELAGPRKH